MSGAKVLEIIQQYQGYAKRCALLVQDSINASRPLFGGDYNSFVVAVKVDVLATLYERVKFTISTEKPQAIVKLENASEVLAEKFFAHNLESFKLCDDSGNEITKESVEKKLNDEARENSIKFGWSNEVTDDHIRQELLKSAKTFTFQGSPEDFVEKVNVCLESIGMPKVNIGTLRAPTISSFFR